VTKSKPEPDLPAEKEERDGVIEVDAVDRTRHRIRIVLTKGDDAGASPVIL